MDSFFYEVNTSTKMAVRQDCHVLSRRTGERLRKASPQMAVPLKRLIQIGIRQQWEQQYFCQKDKR